MSARRAQLAAAAPGIVVVLALLIAHTVGAATPAASANAGRALLARTAARYRGVTRLELSGVVRVESGDTGARQSFDAPFVIAAVPGKMRDELIVPQQGSLRIADGTQSWIYMPSLGQYQRQPGVAPAPDSLAADASFGAGLLAMLRTLDDSVATVVGRPGETLTVDGRAHACDVLEVAYATAQRAGVPHESQRLLWIDRQDHLVWRYRSTLDSGPGRVITQDTRFSRARVGAPVADSLFVFHPPPGAREVSDWVLPGQPERVDLTGQPAADFQLSDLNGRTVTLSALKGQVVLVDFWATWCGPCRMTMPLVDKLKREYEGRGLVVLSINLREDRNRARTFIESKGYVMTTLLDHDGEVAGHYQVNGIPALFVVNREGVIAAQLVGAHPDPDVRAALARAGLR